MKEPLRKISIFKPEQLAECLGSAYSSVRFGCSFCLNFAETVWPEAEVLKTARAIHTSGKTPEFQTLLAPSSAESVSYTKKILKALEALPFPVKLAIGDLGFLSLPYSGDKVALSCLKLSNAMDLSLLSEFGVREVEVNLLNKPGKDIAGFIAAAHREGFSVEVVIGHPPVFLTWKCMFSRFYSKDCEVVCRKLCVPVFPHGSKVASFYIRGKASYPANEVSLKLPEGAEAFAFDSTVFYQSLVAT